LDTPTGYMRRAPVRVSAGQGPLQHVVAGEGFEPSKLSRWIYRPTAASLWPATMSVPTTPSVRITHRQPVTAGHRSEHFAFPDRPRQLPHLPHLPQRWFYNHTRHPGTRPPSGWQRRFARDTGAAHRMDRVPRPSI